MKNRWFVLAGVLVFVLVFSWINKNNTPVLDWPKEVDFVAEVTLPNSKVINVGISDTETERTQGLAGVINLASDEGMWFVFEKLGYYAFWMRGTIVSLDIVWIDDNLKIIDIEPKLQPAGEIPTPEIYKNTRPAMYVLELLGGTAKKNGLKIGDQLQFNNL